MAWPHSPRQGGCGPLFTTGAWPRSWTGSVQFRLEHPNLTNDHGGRTDADGAEPRPTVFTLASVESSEDLERQRGVVTAVAPPQRSQVPFAGGASFSYAVLGHPVIAQVRIVV